MGIEVDVAVRGPLESFPDLVFVACLRNFFDRTLGCFVQVHGVCLREVLSLLQVGVLVHFRRVGLASVLRSGMAKIVAASVLRSGMAKIGSSMRPDSSSPARRELRAHN